MMKKFCSKFEFRWEYFLILFILLEVLVFGMMNSKFLMPRVLFGSFNDFISICIIASHFCTFLAFNPENILAAFFTL